MLDGVPLQQLAPPLRGPHEEEGDEPSLGALSDVPEDFHSLVRTPCDELQLDGIRLADLGATEVDSGEEFNLAVCYGLQLTPEALGAGDEDFLLAQGEVQEFFTMRRPNAVILGRGAGGASQAVKGSMNVTHIVCEDWMMFEFLRSNGGSDGVVLVRQSLQSPKCQGTISEAKPEVLLGLSLIHISEPTRPY